jgi:hypothetical protein
MSLSNTTLKFEYSAYFFCLGGKKMTSHTDLELIEIGKVAVKFISAQKKWTDYLFKTDYEPTCLRSTVEAKKPYSESNRELYHLVFKDEK